MSAPIRVPGDDESSDDDYDNDNDDCDNDHDVIMT